MQNISMNFIFVDKEEENEPQVDKEHEFDEESGAE